ncbi:MAG: cysteine desulfurase [Lysobacterales bacterium]|jgi:cysteine desulfurase
MKRIYFDYASTTPVDPQVIEAMNPYFFEKFGNASSPHALGQESLSALEEARNTLALFICAHSSEIVFNSGATEGCNHAISGIAYSAIDQGKDHIIVSAIEHHAILEPVEQLRDNGFKVTFVDVDENGVVSPEAIKEAITDKTMLVAVMHGSNEIGTIQPIKEISQITKEHNVPFLVDACQTVGHIPINVKDLGCDLLTLSAHKFYGPKGIGALYIREGLKLSSFLLGGDQERSRRASTQNVAGAVGLASAIKLCASQMDEEIKEQTRLRDRLMTEIPKVIEGTKINGHMTQRLPNNVHFSFNKVQGESVLMSLDFEGICASMGSACTSGAMEASHVLRSIGLDDDMSFGALRLTLGRWTTDEHIDYLLEKLPGIIVGLRI